MSCTTNTIFPMMAAAVFDQSYQEIVKDKFDSILHKKLSKHCSYLIQFWAPIKEVCLDTLIPTDVNNDEVGLLGPLGRVFKSGLPEINFGSCSYAVIQFPMLKNAIRLGIRQYFAIPVLKLHDKHCVGVLEFASAEPYVSYFIPGLIELYDNAGLGQMETALDVICTIHSLLFAQIWILDPNHATSINALISAGTKSYDSSSTVYGDFADASSFSYIQTGKGVVGRAFSSQGSCFRKDVTLLSLTEYPLVPTARIARLTECFAICLKNTRADKLVYVVEYFLPPRGMVDRDVEIFLNMILSTMREPLPGVTVASGKELGQRMLVEVLNVSPCDELDSFEIGQPLPIFQSLQERGETTEIYSLCQQSNIHDWEDNLSTGLLVPSCSSRRLD
ncbi:hypothetical protein T459_32568 [Capsicum annuum]|uniref:NLP1-9 GAF domain-containing protein n=2 Tax=Capsicum annuum TaxID=4072 RepID=A0A2G2Y1G9_CAPAN|nr:hypothetical protein T459_32568 [Capsicum annuum]